MKSLKNYVKNYINNYINESIWDIEDNVDDNNEEMIKGEILKFLDECYFCEERFKNTVPSQTVQITTNKNQIIVNCHCSVHTANDITVLTNGLFEWGTIKGWFSCADCSKLETLKGAPSKVNGNFYCNGCPITSLEGAPEYVESGFNCSFCPITSLNGAPKEVEGDLWVKGMRIFKFNDFYIFSSIGILPLSHTMLTYVSGFISELSILIHSGPLHVLA